MRAESEGITPGGEGRQCRDVRPVQSQGDCHRKRRPFTCIEEGKASEEEIRVLDWHTSSYKPTSTQLKEFAPTDVQVVVP